MEIWWFIINDYDFKEFTISFDQYTHVLDWNTPAQTIDSEFSCWFAFIINGTILNDRIGVSIEGFIFYSASKSWITLQSVFWQFR